MNSFLDKALQDHNHKGQLSLGRRSLWYLSEFVCPTSLSTIGQRIVDDSLAQTSK